MKRSPWSLFSKKLVRRITHPQFLGEMDIEEARAKRMRLAVGRVEGRIALYLLVDEEDGVIADAKFTAFAPPLLMGALDMACELLMRKNYDQAKRITVALIDQSLRDRGDTSAFSSEDGEKVALVLEAIHNASDQCTDIPLADGYIAPPMPLNEALIERYPGWESLGVEERRGVIEAVIERDIRPYIELDAGGVTVVSLQGDEVVIAYSGSCTSCYSATGATLSAIQEILRTKIDPNLRVTPDLSSLLPDTGSS